MSREVATVATVWLRLRSREREKKVRVLGWRLGDLKVLEVGVGYIYIYNGAYKL